MHMKYHLPVKFYQLVRRKPRDLSATAKDRLIALKVWRSLRESGLSAEQSMDMVEELVPEENNQAEIMKDKPMESEASDQEYVPWDYYNFPSQFPDYTDGRIQKPFMLQDSYPVVVGIEDTSVQAIEDYVQRAINEGFELLWEQEAQGDEDLGWAVNKSTDEEHYSIMLSYYEDFYGLPDFVNLVLDVREKQ